MKNFFKLIFISIFITAFIACQHTNEEKLLFEDFTMALQEKPIGERQAFVEKYLSTIGSTPVIEGKENVHFVWFGKADSVLIQGDLQSGWSKADRLTKINCGDRNVFYISYLIPSDAQLEYQFIVNNQVVLDYRNPEIVEHFIFGDRNSFQMPDFKPSNAKEFRRDVSKGRIESQVFKSKNPEFADRKLEVYQPNGYSDKGAYPVLFVNDGEIKLYATPFKAVLDNLIYDRVIEPIIVVFIPHMERTKEYCYQDFAYASVIAEELVPFIDENYKTIQRADKRVIMGSSMGGNISMVTGFLYPEIIANVGAQGGAGGGIIICNADSALSVYLEKKDEHPLNSIFASVATYDLEGIYDGTKLMILDDARKFHKKLDSLGIEHVYKEFNNGHNESNWIESLDELLIQFFGI